MGLLNIFSRKSDEDRLEVQAEKLVEVQSLLAGASKEISMMRRILVEKIDGIESCNVCVHFKLPDVCEIVKDLVVKPSGWCPHFRRKLA